MINVIAKLQKLGNKGMRYVCRAQRYSTIKADDVCEYAAQSAGIPVSQVKAFSIALGEAIRYFVLNGHHVEIGDFGFIGLTLKGRAVDATDQAKMVNVKRLKLSYTPSKKLNELMGKVKFNVQKM